MLVQPNNAAHDATVFLKMGLPIRVTEHDVRRAVGATLIRCVEETAKIRMNAQYVEVVPGHGIGPSAGWIFACVQSYLIDGKACQTVEAAVAIAQIEIVQVRLPHVMFVSVLDSVKAFCLGHTQRAKYQPVQYAKHYGVRANCQGQRQNGDDCESGRLAQHSKTEARILYQNLDKIAADRFAALLS